MGEEFIFGLERKTGLPAPVFLPFVVFLTAATAEVNRVPFDLPEAESELVGGYFTEYTGMRFALFQLGEYAEAFAMAALTSVLFLGGWHGPWLPGIVWFFIKMFALVFFLIWVRWTYPRLRLDQLLNLSWKGLVPLGVVLVLVRGWLLVWGRTGEPIPVGELAAFIILAIVTLLPAVVVVTSRNLVRAAMSLIPSFLGVTGLFVLLQAEVGAGGARARLNR